MIFVAGATGFLGGEISRRLVERGEAVRGLVRITSDPGSVERLRAVGVECVIGDVRDRASLDRACRGIDTVRIFEEAGAAPFTVQRVPDDAVRAQFDAATDSLQKSFAGLMLDHAKGDEISMGDTLERFPVSLTSVRDYARSILGMSSGQAAARS